MTGWTIKDKQLKHYPHFDPPIKKEEAIALATNPARVVKHKFFPFMRFTQKWNRFAPKGGSGKVKERPIRYAARSDAYIFMYYRYLLSSRYEAALADRGLSGTVLAYRRILTDEGVSGKCNIHHAKDAFERIRHLGDCHVIALDISSFFESLDHQRLYEIWSELIGVKKLPPDHLAVFRRITKYSFVDREAVYERLGHFGPKRKDAKGNDIPGYLTPKKKMPTHLCRGITFRRLVAGGGGSPSLIQCNPYSFGIPQGSPISDLLANLYLLEFDTVVSQKCAEFGGFYMRYSDDILVGVPAGEKEARELEQWIRCLIPEYGDQLRIKEEKSSIFRFFATPRGFACTLLDADKGRKGRNGLEYLGFRFDGSRVYLRDSTLSGLWRKITRVVYREAMSLSRRYPDKTAGEIAKLASVDRVVQRFGRVEQFEEKAHDVSNWTFWTYSRRASDVFGSDGLCIRRQMAGLRGNIRRRLDDAIAKTVMRRGSRAPAR